MFFLVAIWNGDLSRVSLSRERRAHWQVERALNRAFRAWAVGERLSTTLNLWWVLVRTRVTLPFFRYAIIVFGKILSQKRHSTSESLMCSGLLGMIWSYRVDWTLSWCEHLTLTCLHREGRHVTRSSGTQNVRIYRVKCCVCCRSAVTWDIHSRLFACYLRFWKVGNLKPLKFSFHSFHRLLCRKIESVFCTLRRDMVF